MKKLMLVSLLVIGIFSTGLFAQIELKIVGGLNFGSVRYNDKDIADNVDVSTKTGLIIGLETIGRPFNIGVAYVKRGAKYEVDGLDLKVSESYNYLTGYLILPISIQKELSAFGGCQIGISLGGISEVELYGVSESVDLEADDFNTDFGLLFGADYMLNPKIGVRASYYLGLSDVANGIESDYNFKNRGIAINFLYKI